MKIFFSSQYQCQIIMKGPLGISKHPSANTGRMVLGAYDRYVPEPKVNARAASKIVFAAAHTSNMETGSGISLPDRGRDQTQEQES